MKKSHKMILLNNSYIGSKFSIVVEDNKEREHKKFPFWPSPYLLPSRVPIGNVRRCSESTTPVRCQAVFLGGRGTGNKLSTADSR
jgi:hypothetical protein